MPWRDVPLPPRMAALPKDRRGLPVPYIVLVTDDGTPHFTINDSRKVAKVLRERRCAICGGKHHRGLWLVGGPMSAFHEDGAYLDPPLHFECAQYALKVCPYLAAPKYSGRLDDATLTAQQVEQERLLTLVDHTMLPDRPDVFVAGMTLDYQVIERPTGPAILPKRPWKQVRFFQKGEELSHSQATGHVAKALMNVPPAQRRVPRGVIAQILGERVVGAEMPPHSDDR